MPSYGYVAKPSLYAGLGEFLCEPVVGGALEPAHTGSPLWSVSQELHILQERLVDGKSAELVSRLVWARLGGCND